jgi:malonyl-CoA O-methyltransferase
MAALPPSAVRPFDAVAVRALLRRLAAQTEPPWLHAEIARRMGERLALIRLQPAQVVDWWSGLGAGGAVLAAAYPQARRIAVEPDAVWLAKVRAREARPWWSFLRGRRGAVETTTEAALDGGAAGLADGEAGLVWSNMGLHLASDPPALFERWERLLGPDGFVMFSCPGPGTLRELRAVYARLGWAAPGAPFIDMHDLGDMLVRAGFADPVMDQETLTLRWDSADALLAELRSLGGNTAPERSRGLRTPRWRAALARELDALRATDGRIGLSFEVAYGHAFKAPPRARVAESTTVSLDAMRAMIRSGRAPGGTDAASGAASAGMLRAVAAIGVR